MSDAVSFALGEPEHSDAAPSAGRSGPRLLDRVRATIRARHYSRRTEQAYVRWIVRYVHFHRLRHPRTMGEPEITAFVSSLALGRRTSASTQNQALSAVLSIATGGASPNRGSNGSRTETGRNLGDRTGRRIEGPNESGVGRGRPRTAGSRKRGTNPQDFGLES